MDPSQTITLSEAEPDLVRFLNRDESEQARETRLPVRALPAGDVGLHDLLEHSGAFGALVLDGMITQALRLGGHTGLRLLGPGDMVPLTNAPRSLLVFDTRCRAMMPTRL